MPEENEFNTLGRSSSGPRMVAFKPQGERGPTVYRDMEGIASWHLARMNSLAAIRDFPARNEVRSAVSRGAFTEGAIRPVLSGKCGSCSGTESRTDGPASLTVPPSGHTSYGSVPDRDRFPSMSSVTLVDSAKRIMNPALLLTGDIVRIPEDLGGQLREMVDELIDILMKLAFKGKSIPLAGSDKTPVAAPEFSDNDKGVLGGPECDGALTRRFHVREGLPYVLWKDSVCSYEQYAPGSEKAGLKDHNSKDLGTLMLEDKSKCLKDAEREMERVQKQLENTDLLSLGTSLQKAIDRYGLFPGVMEKVVAKSTESVSCPKPCIKTVTPRLWEARVSVEGARVHLEYEKGNPYELDVGSKVNPKSGETERVKVTLVREWVYVAVVIPVWFDISGIFDIRCTKSL